MAWAAFFLALAIAGAWFGLGDVAVAAGILAVAIGWRPIFMRVRFGKRGPRPF